MPAVLLPNGKQQFFTTPGVPAVGYKLATFAAGTSSNQTTWADALKVAANTNPIILDARGEAVIFWDGAYKVQLQDSTGAVIWTVDNVSSLVASLLANFALDTGAVNAYIAAGATAAYQAGLQVSVKIATTNTGASTLNYGGLGARNIFLDGHALSGGELQAGNIYALEYDGAVFQLLNSTNPTLIRTPAEIAAGVTPVNLTIPSHLQTGNVFIVERYGNNTVPGTTDMSGAFTTAVKMAQRLGGTVTYGGSGQLMLLNAVNCTFGTSGNQKGVIIQGPDAGIDSNALSSPSFFPLVAKHTQSAVFDCTGNDSICFKDVAFGTDPVTYPKTGILTARNNTGGGIIFRAFNTKIAGHFSVANYYNFGSEDDLNIGCYFVNFANTADTKVRVYTGSNSHFAIVPAFSTDNFGNAVAISAINVSALEHTNVGCVDANHGGQTTSDTYYIEQSDSGRVYSGVLVCDGLGATGGRAHVYVDMTNAPSNLWSFDGVTCDNSPHPPSYVLAFSNHVATPSGFSLRNIRSICQTNCIAALGTNPTIDSLYVSNLLELVTRGLSIPGTLQNSTISSYLQMTIGTSTKNNLQGDATAWTITTLNGGSITHTGPALTFAPGLVTGVNGWTAASGFIQRARYTYEGNSIKFTILVAAAAGTLSCTAGATITTLPGPLAKDDDTATVMDTTTKTLVSAIIGGGTHTITLPAITATADEILISGSYFVS